jgi:hypothetical protein
MAGPGRSRSAGNNHGRRRGRPASSRGRQLEPVFRKSTRGRYRRPVGSDRSRPGPGEAPASRSTGSANSGWCRRDGRPLRRSGTKRRPAEFPYDTGRRSSAFGRARMPNRAALPQLLRRRRIRDGVEAWWPDPEPERRWRRASRNADPSEDWSISCAYDQSAIDVVGRAPDPPKLDHAT